MDEWLPIKENLFLCYFVSLWSWRVDKLLVIKKKFVLMLPCLTLKWTSWQVDELTSCLLTYLLVNLITLSLFTSNLFTRLTCQLVNFRKDNSQTKNQKGTNSVRINALWACKRCPLRPLLTPFWNPIKHLLVCSFITYWFSVSCKLAF